MTGPTIETRGLTKRYGHFTAVEDLDLTIGAGEVFGLLGPNGSGKTTTILMLLGLTDVTAGSVRVCGLDPARQPLAVKGRVGYLPDTVGFYGTLSARDNLRYTARLIGMDRREMASRIDEVLGRVRLSEVADQRVSTFSHGMRQRLGLAEILLKRPTVAILDEPTTGLDPQSTREFLEAIRTLTADGMSVLLSSHLLNQVQAVCDRVGLFHRGRMVLEGTVPDIAKRILGGTFHIAIEAHAPDLDLSHALGDVPGVAAVTAEGDGRFRLEANADVRAEVAAHLARRGAKILGLALVESGLDEIYNRYFEEVAHAKAA